MHACKWFTYQHSLVKIAMILHHGLECTWVASHPLLVSISLSSIPLSHNMVLFPSTTFFINNLLHSNVSIKAKEEKERQNKTLFFEKDRMSILLQLSRETHTYIEKDYENSIGKERQNKTLHSEKDIVSYIYIYI